MATSYPKDRFDELPNDLDRVGSHRAPRKRGRGWIAFGWALLATVVLVVAGAIGLMFINNGLDFTAPAASDSPSAVQTTAVAPPTAEPTTDPTLTVTVLNGTPKAGLAGEVGDSLETAGWNVGTTANASATDVATTIVYYADASLEGAARGVAEAVPGATVSLSQDFADSGAQLVVVVGADYAPAG